MTFSRWKGHVQSASSGAQERHPLLTIRVQSHSLKGETGDAPFKRAQGPPIRADHLDTFRHLWFCASTERRECTQQTPLYSQRARKFSMQVVPPRGRLMTSIVQSDSFSQGSVHPCSSVNRSMHRPCPASHNSLAQIACVQPLQVCRASTWEKTT